MHTISEVTTGKASGQEDAASSDGHAIMLALHLEGIRPRCDLRMTVKSDSYPSGYGELAVYVFTFTIFCYQGGQYDTSAR